MSDNAARDAWIVAHGSERLKLALSLGLADKSDGTYRDERLALELGPDWRWVPEKEISDAYNPSLIGLRALQAARESGYPVELVKVRPTEGDEWQEAIAVVLPWAPKRRAYVLVTARGGLTGLLLADGDKPPP